MLLFLTTESLAGIVIIASGKFRHNRRRTTERKRVVIFEFFKCDKPQTLAQIANARLSQDGGMWFLPKNCNAHNPASFKNPPVWRPDWQRLCCLPLDEAVKPFSSEPQREVFFAALDDLCGDACCITRPACQFHHAGLESER